MNKKVNTDLLEEKIKLYKDQIIKYALARDIVVIFISSAVLLADLGAHLHKGISEQLVILITYFYGGLSLTHISLEISYKIKKADKYITIIDKYKYIGVNEDEAKNIQKELTDLNQNRVSLINVINSIINTMPITYFLCLGYYILHISGI